ncbi:hypothetical protein TEA_019959 [Camellia sinensis var. sinensis]|uniref:Apple domain-containing protein n=1 Tax=Camellia sinensis var. sinensis TaxID=542762 RepID=A0A4S4DZG7_CAMSN|nr:hypothetical protein TEA_019959 [Camellia sinensis var. sinensis]
MTLKECETMCLKNCSCMSYANSDASGEGSGCLLWFDELVNIRVIENDQDLYVRMAASEFEVKELEPQQFFLLSILSSFEIPRGQGTGGDIEMGRHRPVNSGELGLDNFFKQVQDIEKQYEALNKLLKKLQYAVRYQHQIALAVLSSFNWPQLEQGKDEHSHLSSLNNNTYYGPWHFIVHFEEGLDKERSKAMDNFAINNKLGEGRFGSVYKGMLEGGQEIAVKLLSKYSNGYMSPEYAIEGLFLVKIGIRNSKRLYKEDRTRELIDEPIQNSCNLPEVLRSIHVGLLCVQQRPEDRPKMASVVLMLGGEGALTHSKQPGFFTERNTLKTESTGSEVEQCSTNMVSTTVVV